MTAFSCIASLLSLAAIARADGDDHDHEHELTIEIIATWDSFAAGLFIAPESVEYNADDNLWYVNNWYGFGTNDTDEDRAGEMATLSGDYPVTDPFNFDLMEDIMDAKAILPAGMVYTSGGYGYGYGKLFVADIGAGVVHKFDTFTNTYVGATDFINPTANGLCIDSENNVLYVTTTGWDFNTNVNTPAGSGLYSVDPETLEVTRVYDASGTDAAAFADDYVFNPNGCYVKDGSVYMVDVQLLGLGGSLGVYDIATGELTRNAEVLATHPACDGIVYADGYWFVSDVGQGQLLALDTAEEGGIFEVVLENMPGAADICLGPDNTIAIPSVEEGTIWFAQFTIEHDTTSTETPTTTTDTPTTDSPSTTDDDSPSTTDSHDDSHDEHMDELTISLLETWDSTAAGLNMNSESIEYNGDDDLWYVANWYVTNDTDKGGEIGSLSGDYPVTSTTNFDLMEDIMDVKASPLPAGMVYHNGFLFIADIGLGVVHKFDTSSNSYVAAATTGPIANGLCMDYDNDMLYATSTGLDFDGSITGTVPYAAVPALSGLWSIDPETLEATRVYDGAASAFPDGFVMAPNGCYVKDEVVYMVDMADSESTVGNLGMYDIATGELTRDAVVLADHARCDGIVYYDGFWFVTDVGQGQLLALNTAEEGGIFEVVLENMPGAADICLGPDNTIAIPSTTGTIYFAQFEIGHEHDSSEDDSSAARVCLFSALAIIVAALV